MAARKTGSAARSDVVVTHQHPGHVSMLPNLLSKVAEFAVVEAHDGLKVEPNRVCAGPLAGLLAISNVEDITPEKV